VKQEDVALGNLPPRQFAQAPAYQFLRQPTAAVRRQDRQMVKIPAPPVVPAQDSADNLATQARDRTHAGIPPQVGRYP
jgi:hypothetical protein